MSMSTLEVLRAARARLTGGEPFEFVDWPQCACGHIYAATTGHVAEDSGPVSDPDPGPYLDHIATVAEALGWTEPEGEDGFEADLRDPVIWVSDATLLRARDRVGPEDPATVTVEDAVFVVDQAIAAIEKSERQAMLAAAAPEAVVA